MKRVVVEIWHNGQKRRTYLEYFQYGAKRSLLNAQAVANVKRNFGHRHPRDAEYRITLGS